MRVIARLIRTIFGTGGAPHSRKINIILFLITTSTLSNLQATKVVYKQFSPSWNARHNSILMRINAASMPDPAYPTARVMTHEIRFLCSSRKMIVICAVDNGKHLKHFVVDYNNRKLTYHFSWLFFVRFQTNEIALQLT